MSSFHDDIVEGKTENAGVWKYLDVPLVVSQIFGDLLSADAWFEKMLRYIHNFNHRPKVKGKKLL